MAITSRENNRQRPKVCITLEPENLAWLQDRAKEENTNVSYEADKAVELYRKVIERRK